MSRESFLRQPLSHLDLFVFVPSFFLPLFILYSSDELESNQRL